MSEHQPVSPGTFHAPRWPPFLQRPALFRAYDTVRDVILDWRERIRLARRTLPASAERVLVIREKGLGDVLQVSTILERIRTRYRAKQLDVLTSSGGAFLLQAHPAIDQCLTTDALPEDLASRYDLFINLHVADHSDRIREIVQALPRDRLIGRCYRDDVKEGWLDSYPRDCFLHRYCRIADVPYSDELPVAVRFHRPDNWQARCAEIAKRLCTDTTKPIAVCIGGAGWKRNFSLAYLDQLLNHLKEHAPLVLVGMRKDRSVAEHPALESILTKHPDVLDLLDCPLDEMCLALDTCAALVTPDTGPLHMALALQTPVVGLFGFMTGREYLGNHRQGERFSILLPDMPCVGCRYRQRLDCTTQERALCMDAHTPESICAELRRMGVLA